MLHQEVVSRSMGAPVLSEGQARAITGGRKPLVPVKYEEACKALVECQTIEDAKYWDNKADALTAWAKIYKNDQAGLESKRLKLHAYRRMGELAAELRPGKVRRSKGRGSAGPVTLLEEQGFSHSQAICARALALMPNKKFNAIVNAPKPPTPRTARLPDSVWQFWANRWSQRMSQIDVPEVFVSAIDPKDIPLRLAQVRGEIEWLDRAEQLLSARQ